MMVQYAACFGIRALSGCAIVCVRAHSGSSVRSITSNTGCVRVCALCMTVNGYVIIEHHRHKNNKNIKNQYGTDYVLCVSFHKIWC